MSMFFLAFIVTVVAVSVGYFLYDQYEAYTALHDRYYTLLSDYDNMTNQYDAIIKDHNKRIKTAESDVTYERLEVLRLTKEQRELKDGIRALIGE